jgi:hypothetical protein
MSTMSRRRFIRNASLSAAAAGTAVALPNLVGSAAAAAPLASGPARVGAATTAGSGRGPLVAHVVDASTGQVALLFGDSEVVRYDPPLVQALLQAAR